MCPKNSLRVSKFSISLLVPADFERKNIGEINSPFLCSVYSITPLGASSLIFSITFCGTSLLITLVFWLKDSCSKSNVNPSTVFKISLSDVIFSHSWILLEYSYRCSSETIVFSINMSFFGLGSLETVGFKKKTVFSFMIWSSFKTCPWWSSCYLVPWFGIYQILWQFVVLFR